MRMRNQAGFKMIDLMFTVTILGLLMALAVPNYVSLRRRAQEGAVKANMHTLQVALEDFAVQNESFYPVSASASLPDGTTLAQLCPTGSFPLNPFTHLPSIVNFNAGPTSGHSGELAVDPALTSSYTIMGNNPLGAALSFVLTSGQ